MNEIKTGFIEKFGKVYKIIDREASEVGYYTESGNLIESRPATFEEKSQLTIQFKRAVNE